MLEHINKIRKAIVGLVVPIAVYLVSVDVLPEPPEGQTVEDIALAITGAVTGLLVWLVPNAEGR